MDKITSDTASKIDKPKIAISDKLRFIEPATILSLGIGAMYYLGWVYVNAYFHRIGINHLSIELPISFYLMQGYISVVGLWIFANILFLFHETESTKPTKSQAIAGNLILFVVVLATFYPSYDNSIEIFYLSIIIIFIFFTFLFYKSWQKDIVLEKLPLYSTRSRIGLSFLLYGLLLLNAYFTGDQRGKLTVEGKYKSDVSGISFIWKDSPPSDIADKQVILILHNGEKYYVVERANVAPKHPKVYVIPDELVKYVVLSNLQD